ncbi:MAG: hypothetical protein Tsb0013_09060 [Phycisphaerales bacterium]
MKRGFTLVELASVMVVVSILAITAAPVLSRVADTRREALAGEVERVLALARSRALTTGLPAGVRVDVGSQTLGLLEKPEGSSPRAFMEAYVVPQRISGVTISSFINEERTDSVWFAPDATPHARSDAGVFLADLTVEATISIEGGPTVRIEPNSGRITR